MATARCDGAVTVETGCKRRMRVRDGKTKVISAPDSANALDVRIQVSEFSDSRDANVIGEMDSEAADEEKNDKDVDIDPLAMPLVVVVCLGRVEIRHRVHNHRRWKNRPQKCQKMPAGR